MYPQSATRKKLANLGHSTESQSISDNYEQQKMYAQAKGVSGKAAMWQQKAEEHEQKQKTNPFSQWEGATHMQKLDTHDESYGKPPPGSKTEMRGKQATQHISGEVIELCQIIHDIGHRIPGPMWAITFGTLFETYTKISNKLVGMLMRARRHGLIHFEGEMLYQRRDDDVVIYLQTIPEQLREYVLLRNPDLREMAEG